MSLVLLLAMRGLIEKRNDAPNLFDTSKIDHCSGVEGPTIPHPKYEAFGSFPETSFEDVEESDVRTCDVSNSFTR